VDRVNLALTTLLRLRLLTAAAGGAWKETTGLAPLTEAGFRRMALARVREYARGSRFEAGESKYAGR
jgi:hypothetical protein